MERSWATLPQGSSRVPRCAVEGGSARLVACRIGEARLFTRNRAHRHVGCPPKCRLVNHDERRPYRWNSGSPVSDPGPILRHRSGPSSQLSGLPDSWRVLKTRKDSDSHPPPLPGGGLPVCTGPKNKSQKNFREKTAKICVFFVR